jgi:PAS domain S-box-containing protein
MTARKRSAPPLGSPDSATQPKSDELFRLMVEAVRDYAIFMLDVRGRVVSWNAGAERLKGYSAAEIIGQHFSRFYPPEDVRARKPERELQVAAAEGRWEEEGWRVRKDGSRFWANVLITAIRSADGELLGYAKVTRDVTERHETERALRETDERFRLIVEGAKEYALLMLDPEGRVVSWNAGAERLQGYRSEEIVGQHFSRFYPPEDVQAGKPERALEQAAAEGRWEDEGWRVRKDGSRFWASDIITALQNAEGAPLGFAKLTRDLTERRRADVAQRQNEERLRLMVESVKDYAIIMLDREGRVISWNAGAERTKGYRAEEILGRHFSRFYPPEDVAQGKPEWELERAVREGQLEDEGWRVRKDGSRFWANVVITPIRDAQRVLVGFAKVTRDATERRRNEAEIRRQKAFTEQLINSSTDGILAFDREYRYTLWSEGMARISGVSAEETLGRSSLDVFPFYKDTGEHTHYSAALEGRTVTTEGGRYSARPPAAHTVFEAQYSPLVGESGQVVGGLAIVRDVTDRKRVEEELARSNAELEKFSYSVSHDLRAPLRAIDGFARALHEDYGSTLDADGQRLLGVIRENAQRMGQLIDALLNFSRAGRQQLVSTSTDLTALAQSVVDELRRTVAGVAVEVTLQPLPPIMGDATLLRQVLVNLIGNAFKFTRNRAHPRVDIGARQEGDTVVYYVKDNGAGFDMRYKDKLFGVFQRLHHVEEFEGTGVGLALAQRIIDRHGGRIWAEAKPNDGATFYFTLPSAPPGA